MKAALNHILKLILGWTLVFLGILGLFLPILQGVLFLVLGFALLSTESEWVRNKINAFMARYPKLTEKLKTVKQTIATKRQVGPL